MSPKPLILAAVAMLIPSGLALGGDTDPPPGPIAGTMKPLDAIEPRVCVGDLPPSPGALHAITDVGRYVLTADLLVPAGLHGISVELPPGHQGGRISIDLNGFSITGAPGSGDGIRSVTGVGTPVAVVIIGALTTLGGNLDAQITGMGADAIHLEGDPDEPIIVSLHNLHIADCFDDGVEVLASKKLFVGSLSVADCGGNGFTILDDEHADVRFSRCSATGNGGHGFFKTFMPGNPLYGNITFERCSALSNTLDGFHVEVTGGTIEYDIDRCAASDNGGRGVNVSTSENSSCWIRVAQVRANANGGSGLGLFLAATASADLSLDGCETNDNGQGGDPADGSGVDVSGDPGGAGGGGRVAVNVDDHTSNGNLAFSAIMKSVHDTAKAVIQNMRCVGSGDTGVDIEGFDVTARDLHCADNGGHGMRVADGSLEVHGGSFEANTLDGILCSDCFPLRYIFPACSRNGGNGLTVGALAAPYIPGGAVVSAAISCVGNGGDGISVSGATSLTLTDAVLSDNTGAGLSVTSAGPGGATVTHLRNCSADNNGVDGFSIFEAAGGRVVECSANSNGGAGLRVGEGPFGLATHLQIDRCVASSNSEGFVIADTENYFTRCIAMANALINFSINPGNAAGPTSTFGGWDEAKPYTWP